MLKFVVFGVRVRYANACITRTETAVHLVYPGHLTAIMLCVRCMSSYSAVCRLRGMIEDTYASTVACG